MPQLEWGARVPLLTSRTCDRHMLRTSWWFFLPLVFLFVSAVVMPIVLFRNNLHRTTLIKVVVWTPVVPSSCVQLLSGTPLSFPSRFLVLDLSRVRSAGRGVAAASRTPHKE